MTTAIKRRLRTVKQLAHESDGLFTEGSLRWIIFHQQSNGPAASGAILRLGRRILVDEELFYGWVTGQNGGGGNDD